MPVSTGPGAADITLYQGDDFACVVDVSNADGTPADLTGYVVLAQLRRSVADEAPEVELEFTTQINGSMILLSLTHEQTAGMIDRYAWDLDLTDTAGMVTTVLAGRVAITQEVSRPVITVAAPVRKASTYVRR